MFKFIYYFIICLCFFIKPVWADVIAVPSSEARLWATEKGQKIIEALSEPNLEKKYATLDKMMTEDVNLDYVSKFVMGKYMRIMNEEQKKRYQNLFQRYVLSLYKNTSFTFNPKGLDFSIDNVTEHDKFTAVSCLVDAGKVSKDIQIEKIPVRFKLIRGQERRIQAVDVEISGVSMVIEYRKRFYQMLMQEDENIDWFLEKFEDKVKANEKAFVSSKHLIS